MFFASIFSHVYETQALGKKSFSCWCQFEKLYEELRNVFVVWYLMYMYILRVNGDDLYVIFVKTRGATGREHSKLSLLGFFVQVVCPLA